MRFTFPRICVLIALLAALAAPAWAADPVTYKVDHFSAGDGAMDSMLQKIADFYEEEVDAATRDMLAMLEPAIIGMLGLSIGGIVISLYMPLFAMIAKLAG